MMQREKNNVNLKNFNDLLAIMEIIKFLSSIAFRWQRVCVVYLYFVFLPMAIEKSLLLSISAIICFHENAQKLLK
jgi:hypothetical protein